MHSAIEKLISILEAEVGYLGKKTNSQLDNKTANAGGKYTKYARDLDSVGFYNGKKNGYDWCDTFADWSYCKAVGVDAALAITGQKKGGLGAACGYSVQYYKAIGQFHTENPQVGDQAFLSNDKGTTFFHTGIVYKVTASYVWLIEGNTGNVDPSKPECFGVGIKKYSRANSKIYGYGTPKWELVVDDNVGTYTAEETYYKKLKDIPSFYAAAIQKMVNKKYLQGGNAPAKVEDTVLNVSETFCRMATIMDRMGLLK